MPLFQTTVVKKYLKNQQVAEITKKWEVYENHFLNPTIQENIRNSKEEQYKEGFLRDLFVNILGYTQNPDTNQIQTTDAKIDQMVYELYGLTDDEISIIENS